MGDNPLINIGELSKPATILIEKISDVVGGMFKPYQIVRVAKAEAEAERIRAESQIQVTDIHRRAFLRFLEEEAKKQSNIESVTLQALPLLESKSSPENVENDWIANFFDKCRLISDNDMQQLWSRILAGEANSPGAFTKRTVNLLGDLEKSDAELFTRLCDFAWLVHRNADPLIFDTHAEIYKRHGIHFGAVSHLETLGLVRFGGVVPFQRLGLPKVVQAFYNGKSVELVFPSDIDNTMEVGYVIFTRAGQEIARVCEPEPVDGFFNFVYDRWVAQGFLPRREAEQASIAAAP